VAKHTYGPEERQRLLDKIDRIADNLADVDGERAAPAADAHGLYQADQPVRPLARPACGGHVALVFQ